MRDPFVVFVIIGLIIMLAVLELVSAALPVLIVITFVPPEEREALAAVLAAADSSHRLRLWTALRLAVTARRADRRRPPALPYPGAALRGGRPDGR